MVARTRPRINRLFYGGQTELNTASGSKNVPGGIAAASSATGSFGSPPRDVSPSTAPEHRREAEYVRRTARRRRFRAEQWGRLADVDEKTGGAYAASFRRTADEFAAEATEMEAGLNLRDERPGRPGE
jgi:hypothetical protein